MGETATVNLVRGAALVISPLASNVLCAPRTSTTHESSVPSLTTHVTGVELPITSGEPDPSFALPTEAANPAVGITLVAGSSTAPMSVPSPPGGFRDERCRRSADPRAGRS